MKPFKILTDDYFVGNFGSIEASDQILNSCKKAFPDDNDLLEGGVSNNTIDHKVRKCKTYGIAINEFNFVSKGFEKIIFNVNKMRWNMDLEYEWDARIQYTRYTGKGHFYDWHQDSYPDDPNEPSTKRKLTIVYCLSRKTEYTGGEFQVKRKDGTVYTRKFDYGDFIVFPAIQLHRVKPLKSGNRTTLVGWYL